MFLVMSTYYNDKEDDDDNFIDPTDEEMLEDMYPDEDSLPREDEDW